MNEKIKKLQEIIDALLTGESYDRLPDTYVIFICDFDPFGDQLYRYTARNMIFRRKPSSATPFS